MRVECSHCRELVEIAGLSPVVGGLGFACPRCGGVSLLAPVVPAAPAPVVAPSPAEAPAAPAPASALPPGFSPCPKCGAPHAADVLACARCGLVFAKVASGQAKLPPPPVVAPALRGRWAQLAARLDETEAHFAFIEACGAQNALEFAGHCYRTLTPPGQAEDPRVAVFRERVLRQAAARVQLVSSPRAAEAAAGRQRTRSLVGALVVAFFIGLFTVGYWYSTRLTNAMQLAP
ncbi:hypothetical protein L6V77_12720 [Myxococcota bacterium]|nr:hypothetical protein [Myxococcota bacterium]